MTPDPATNARLCRWLNVEPEWMDWECKGHDSPDVECDCTSVPIYPDLATRDNFLVLWDALRNHPQYFRPEVWATISGACAKIGGTLVYPGDTPWTALYAAAVALMEREAEHG